MEWNEFLSKLDGRALVNKFVYVNENCYGLLYSRLYSLNLAVTATQKSRLDVVESKYSIFIFSKNPP